jgi:hypothetical protein
MPPGLGFRGIRPQFDETKMDGHRGVARPAARTQRRRPRMCTLPLLAGENISARFVVPTVVASVDRVIRCGIDQHGVRRVTRSWVCPAGSRTT